MRRATRLLLLLLVVPLGLLGGVGAQAAPSTGGTVYLTTVPALGGVHIDVDGQVVTTSSDGTASLAVAHLSGIASRTRLAGSSADGRNSVVLTRISIAAHSARSQSHLMIGLNVSSLVSLRLNPGTTGVATATVHAVRLRSITGQVITVDPRRTKTISLLSRQTRLVAGIPQAQPVTWTVDSAQAGAGVSVATARTRFDPFAESVWTLMLVPVRGTVVVDTVPHTAGVVFQLDGATFSTDATGRAKAVVADLNGVGDRLRLSTPQAASDTVSIVQVSKLRSTAAFQRTLEVALNVSRPVSLSFRDPAGAPVPPARISEVQLAGGGAVLTLTGAQIGHPVMLLSVVTRRVGSAWQAQQVRYAVMVVRIEGADAVFAGQQKFNPNTSVDWPVAVSVFDVTVTAHDALFGSLLGLDTWITRPDGTGFQVQLDGAQPTVVPSLVRGNYDIQARAGLLGSDTKVVVSRNQIVDLRVITTLDLIVVAGVVVGIAALLVLVGRSLRRRQHPGLMGDVPTGGGTGFGDLVPVGAQRSVRDPALAGVASAGGAASFGSTSTSVGSPSAGDPP